MTLVSLLLGAWFTAGCFLGLSILIPLAYFIVHGSQTRSHLFLKAREYVLAGTWIDTTAVPRFPSDSAVRAAAARGATHFGYRASALYMVLTPHGRSTPGFGVQWCAYHDNATFNGQPRTAKPALLYWLQVASYRRLGVTEFAARLPSALAALATVLLTYELGRRAFEAFSVSTRHCRPRHSGTVRGRPRAHRARGISIADQRDHFACDGG